MKTFRRERGDMGEELAATYLLQNDFRVLGRNWLCKTGELDIIADKGLGDRRTIHFVEVKLRTSDEFGTGGESVMRAKQERIRKTATQWLLKHNLWEKTYVSFDVIQISGSISAPEIEYFADCF